MVIYRLNMKKLIYIASALLLAIGAITAFNLKTPEVKEGDVIFQISKSAQYPYITVATKSVYTHCGIIVFKDEKPYVLEASNVVKLTPLKEWIDKGMFNYCKVFSVFDEPVRIKYGKYLNKKYDLAFSFDNDKYYCSELVYDIYLTQFNTKLAEPKQIKEYLISGMDEIMAKRKITKEQYAVAPSDILRNIKNKKAIEQ